MNIGHSTPGLDLLREALPRVLAFQAAPPRLPSPGQLQHWLFERPATSAVVLLAFALILLALFNRRNQLRRGTLIAGGVGVLAAGVFALGTFVTTDRERVLAASERFVLAAGAGDDATVDALLSDRMSVRVGGAATTWGRDWVLDSVRRLGETFRFDTFEYRSAQGVTDGPTSARTQFRVVAAGQGLGQAITWWRISWRKGTDGDWRIEDLDLLLINGMRPDGPGAMRLDRFGR